MAARLEDADDALLRHGDYAAAGELVLRPDGFLLPRIDTVSTRPLPSKSRRHVSMLRPIKTAPRLSELIGKPL